MRIDSSLPAHIARAYGVRATRPAGAVSRIDAGARAEPAPPSPGSSSLAPGANVSKLIAARVPGSIDPRTVAMPSLPGRGGDVLQLYTRAADRVEAAVSIQVGRDLDVTG